LDPYPISSMLLVRVTSRPERSRSMPGIASYRSTGPGTRRRGTGPSFIRYWIGTRTTFCLYTMAAVNDSVIHPCVLLSIANLRILFQRCTSVTSLLLTLALRPFPSRQSSGDFRVQPRFLIEYGKYCPSGFALQRPLGGDTSD
jgi:hypothetical protein